MVSLLDIAPAATKHLTVLVRGVEVDVRGISLADIAFLIKTFPEVKEMFAGKDVSFTFDTMLERAPELIYAVLECGTGVRGRAGAKDAVKNLTIEEQTSLLNAIISDTFKDGIGPFVDQVKRLFGDVSDIGSKALGSK